MPRNHRYPLFQTSVSKIFNAWSALKIAIENGQGGAERHAIVSWMKEVIESFFYENDNLEAFEVSEYIATILDQELDTIIEDNSLEETSQQLCIHFDLCKNSRDSDVIGLFAALDMKAQTMPQVCQSRSPDDTLSDEDEEEPMETEQSSQGLQVSGLNQNEERLEMSSDGSSSQCTTPPDDDGWVTVTRSRQRHKKS